MGGSIKSPPIRGRETFGADWPDYESEWLAQARKWAKVADGKGAYGTGETKKREG